MCVNKKFYTHYMDFSVVQRQHQISQPTDITAVILNEARALVKDIWDEKTPIRQIGLGLSRLTHEDVIQLSLFEDPKMEYYREWDRKYDEDKSLNEDAKMLAYERKWFLRRLTMVCSNVLKSFEGFAALIISVKISLNIFRNSFFLNRKITAAPAR